MRRAVVVLLFLSWFAVGAPAADQQAAQDSYQQGNTYFDQDRFADAANAYAQAIAQDPKMLEAYYNRALADEMVDRQRALADWRQFADVAANVGDFKYQVGQASARIQILNLLPTYPAGLQPGRYVSSAGDYYGDISDRSESHRWDSFPIKVFMGSVPTANWAQGSREAMRIWQDLFPMELTADQDDADIRFDWQSGTDIENAAGDERDWVQFRPVGGELSRRKVALIQIALTRNWSKDEMRAIVLHELGHALGIQGHSDSKGDIMYFQVQEKSRRAVLPGYPIPFAWKTLVSKPSQRDINTLIRLYNTPGVVERYR